MKIVYEELIKFWMVPTFLLIANLVCIGVGTIINILTNCIHPHNFNKKLKIKLKIY